MFGECQSRCQRLQQQIPQIADMDALTDQIESVLFVCREVMGKLSALQWSADRSVPGAPSYLRFGLQGS